MSKQQSLSSRAHQRAVPRWARRARELGEDITYVLEGWSNVPRPPAKVVLFVGGCLVTWSKGPPELVERVLSLLGS